MSDPVLAARQAPVAPNDEAVAQYLSIQPSARRFSLRIKENALTAGEMAFGTTLARPIGSLVRDGKYLNARLGPDEWLFIGADKQDEAPVAALAVQFKDRPHALVDISHRQIGFLLSGPLAEAVLSVGCPLDLDLRGFPAGTATRTLLGKVEITLMRDDVAGGFRIECWRSFSIYVQSFLEQAIRHRMAMSRSGPP